jgi:NAD(P)-dependent dehydrogenase (short-subunit alcohol dehydrogenase family)
MRRILITGAGSGFGRAAALQLARNGHKVIAAVHFLPEVGDLERQAAAAGITLRVEKLDLTSAADRKAAFNWDVDVLVNNAAIGVAGPVAEIPLELFRDVFEVNVFATLELTQVVVQQMVERGSGRIIFVSSIAGLSTTAYLGSYCASKHALESVAEALRLELAPHGIQVATLNPGPYSTGFNQRMVDTLDDWYDPELHFTRPTDLAILREQTFATEYDPDDLVRHMVELAEADSGLFRNVHPKQSELAVRERQQAAWSVQQ